MIPLSPNHQYNNNNNEIMSSSYHINSNNNNTRSINNNNNNNGNIMDNSNMTNGNNNNNGFIYGGYYIVVTLKYGNGASSNGSSLETDGNVVELEWVVLDAAAQQPVDKRSLIVSQDDSDINFSLPTTITMFNNYLFSNFVVNQKMFCIVSARPHYIIRLINESNFKGLQLLPHFLHYINLQDEISQYGNGIPLTLESFAKKFDIIQGSWMVEGENELTLALQIMIALLKQGHPFTPIDAFSQQQQQNYNGNSNNVGYINQMQQLQQQQQQQQNQNTYFQQSNAQHNNLNNNNNNQVPNTSVLIRGLPWGVGEDLIRLFFEPLEVSSITIYFNASGKQTGDANVEFKTEEEAIKSLEKHRQMMGSRYIEVIQKSKNIPPPQPSQAPHQHHQPMYHNPHIGNQQHQQQQPQHHGQQHHGGMPFTSNGKVLRLRGLPYNISTLDIKKFLSEYPIRNNNVLMMTADDGRFNGEAFVEFQSVEIAQNVLQNMQNKTMLSRYIEFFPYDRFVSFPNHHHHHQYNNNMNNHHHQNNHGHNVNHHRQNQYNGHYHQNNNNNNNNHIHQYNNSGNHQNNTNNNNNRGVSNENNYENQSIKNRNNTKAQIHHHHHGETNNNGGLTTTTPTTTTAATNTSANASRPETVKLRGLPFSANISDITNFFDGLAIVPNGIKIVYQRERPMGIAYVTFAQSADYEKALEKHKQVMGSRYIEVFPAYSHNNNNNNTNKSENSNEINNFNNNNNNDHPKQLQIEQ